MNESPIVGPCLSQTSSSPPFYQSASKFSFGKFFVVCVLRNFFISVFFPRFITLSVNTSACVNVKKSPEIHFIKSPVIKTTSWQRSVTITNVIVANELCGQRRPPSELCASLPFAHRKFLT